MLSDFYFIPIFAALANLGLFLEACQNGHPYRRILATFYATICLFNASTAALLLSDNANLSMTYWKYFNSPAFLMAAPQFVLLASVLSGRRPWNYLTIGSFVFSGVILFLAIFSSDLIILGFRRFPYGLSPMISPLGGILGALSHISSGIVALFFVLKPVSWLPFLSRRFLITLIVFWVVGFLANFPPLFGMDLPPLHPAIDGVVSILFAIYINKFVFYSRKALRSICNVLVALAIGLTIGKVISAFGFSKDAEVLALVFSCFATATLLALLSYLNQFAPYDKSSNHNQLDLESFGLSKQERRICELIVEGHSRTFIQMVLNVSNGTLRNHFKSIYAKILPQNGQSKTLSKDQLQRLTIILLKQSPKTPDPHSMRASPEKNRLLLRRQVS